MFSLICVWINGWVNNRVAGDFRRHRGHYDVRVMITKPRPHMFCVAATFNNVIYPCLNSMVNSFPAIPILAEGLHDICEVVCRVPLINVATTSLEFISMEFELRWGNLGHNITNDLETFWYFLVLFIFLQQSHAWTHIIQFSRNFQTNFLDIVRLNNKRSLKFISNR